MYSVVLMMALSGGGEAPALHHHGCNGCSGCSGCSGYVSSCCGCSGYVSSCSGCSGCSGCGGCYGGHHHHRHHGCCGCSGSACYGCSGCCGVAVQSCGCCGVAVMSCGCSGAPVSSPAPSDSAPKAPEKVKSPEAMVPAPVTIVVSLPADAKLSVNGFATKSTSSVRTFTSPAVAPGMEYAYSLKGEIVRDGKTVTATKEVAVRAGEQLNVALDFSATVVAMK